MIYPILIAVVKIGTIWIRNKTAKNIALSTVQVLVILTIVEINKKTRQNNDKKAH